jgi:hypothetical protein
MATKDTMRGQWLGTYTGSRSGKITLNIDEGADKYTGYAHLMDGTGQAPITMAILESTGKTNPVAMTATLIVVDSTTHNTLTPQDLATTYPGFTFPTKATVTAKRTGRTIAINWQTDIGTSGTATVAGETGGDNSTYAAKQLTWEKFKTLASTFSARKYIFRGQEQRWKLRTSFHRSGRADVFDFQWTDIPALHRVLSSRTKHIYNLTDADQNGAFWHLVQHHGYPTPLLDWSYSPFVAAFCAYRKISPGNVNPKDKVRIFMFDHLKWHSILEKIPTLRTHKLHLSVMDFTAIDNDRMIPQQALSCVSTIDDIEAYIQQREAEKGETFLQVFDLPASERTKAMTDLSVMGITAGSMFPGIDGTCEEVRERMFNLD